jgi:citronellol/citronellal dehydrogenase
MARLGAKVIIGSRKASNYEPAAVGLSKQTGVEVQGLALDIRDREGLRATVDRIVAEHGRIDVLVNNGGGQFFSPAEAISDKGWDAVIATNLTGTWNLTRAVADASMLAQGGRIINITMLTRNAFPGMTHSVASRAGVEAMTRNLAVEWAGRGIRINAVAPGIVRSSGLRHYPKGLGILEQAQSVVPLKRLASCEEIAWMVAYLASPAGDYITGQTFTIDGGKTLWGDMWPIPDPPGLGEIEIPVEEWEEEG